MNQHLSIVVFFVFFLTSFSLVCGSSHAEHSSCLWLNSCQQLHHELYWCLKLITTKKARGNKSCHAYVKPQSICRWIKFSYKCAYVPLTPAKSWQNNPSRHYYSDMQKRRAVQTHIWRMGSVNLGVTICCRNADKEGNFWITRGFPGNIHIGFFGKNSKYLIKG